MKLHDVHQGVQRNKARKRIGRGPGSGHGKTAGRGHKGQRSRAGFSSHLAFEGGQMPLARRIPKRGFTNSFARTVHAVNVADLNERFENGDEVTIATLRERNLAKRRFDELKILGDGELAKKLKVSAHKFSKSAEEKIKQAGGEVVILPGPKPVVKNKQRKKPEPASS
ncbi:MAG: 50S ribosomal protein L15 [Pirellulales bacterium]|nr:50S ribosomal protein L15 [Pirellulales bacterium]